MNIYCPHCGQGYEVSEKHLNKTLLCETCHKEFLVKFDPTKKRCPACGEEILAVAKKCRFCGEILEPPEEKPDNWPVWKILVAMIIVLLIVVGGALLFGDAVGIGPYLLMFISIVGVLVGIGIPVFVISKICEIARNTKKMKVLDLRTGRFPIVRIDVLFVHSSSHLFINCYYKSGCSCGC